MPKLKPDQVPTYRRHKTSGQAVVTLNGRDVWLGPYNTPKSRQKYNQVIAEWIAAGRQLPPRAESASPTTVNEVVAAWWEHAKSYYRNADGELSKEVDNYKLAIRPLRKLYGTLPAAEFSPLKLIAVRNEYIKLGWCRSNINHAVGRIKRLFRWAVEREMVPQSLAHGLEAVEGLKAGRCEVPEGRQVKPVADAHVEATLPHLPAQVVAMIRLQRLTGMRPGEACIMRSWDLDTSGKLWLYTPQKHKTEHHGHKRTIFLGPQAQEVVKPFLRLDPDAYLFSPAEAEEDRRQKGHDRRVESGTPLSCGNKPGSNRRHSPRRSPGHRYRTASYARAITYATHKAFPLPEHLERGRVPANGRNSKATRWETKAEWRARLGEKWAQVIAWRHEHSWHPHQLRHSAATAIRKAFGLEGSQIILGHRTLAATQVYAEADIEAAKRIMGEVG